MIAKTQVLKIQREFSRGGDALPVMFGALGDAGRIRILKILLRHEDVCVSDIANILGVSVPAASRQLKILETAGLVTRVRQGQMVCYRVRSDNDTARSVIDILEKVAE